MNFEKVKAIAKEAGAIHRKYYKQEVNLHYKKEDFSAGSMVTKVDLEVERLVIKRLEELFPDHNIFGEESGMHDKGSAYTWYIDPLDGTANFARENPLFGFSLGLIHNKIPIFGILYFSLSDELFSAQKGEGAFCNGKPVVVSSNPLKKSLYYARGYYRGCLHVNVELAKAVANTQILNVSSFEMANLAKGNGEIFVGKTSLHDHAAGAVIIREAGGTVTDVEGKEWTDESRTIVATNGVIHDEVLDFIKNDSF